MAPITKNFSIQGLMLIIPSRHEDHRGYFSETFVDAWFRSNISDVGFVQENQSLSVAVGTIRGLHFQRPPAAQGKLVRCITGALFDAAVDLRTGSSTFGKWVGVHLSAYGGEQFWIPPGFAHGFCTLEPDCTVSYKCTDYYSAESDCGVAWDDAEIAVNWPDLADFSTLSAKDQGLPRLCDLPPYFRT